MAETVEKAKPEAKTSALVDWLVERVRENDRGPLAELRRGAGDFPNCGERVLRHVARFFGDDQQSWRTPERDNALLLVATLFALNPADRDGTADMGEVMRAAGEKRGGVEAVERRFLALLGARGDDVAVHLRHAVSLAASSGIAVGWSRLQRDAEHLLSEDEDRRQRVVRSWSRSFWRKSDADASSES